MDLNDAAQEEMAKAIMMGAVRKMEDYGVSPARSMTELVHMLGAMVSASIHNGADGPSIRQHVHEGLDLAIDGMLASPVAARTVN